MDVSSIGPADPAWFPGLDELRGRAPRELRFRGALPPPSSLGVAIVGTRHPSPEGLAIAHAWAGELAARGVVVWSGGALGIDAAAHAGALEVGGATVAVLGSGLGHPCPRANAALFGRIARSGNGAIVSCLADDEAPQTWHFLNRNGVVAACTRVLVVIEAGEQSGARHAASVARRLGRPVAVVPFTPGSGLGLGNVEELTELGAHPVFSAEHVRRLALHGATATPDEEKAEIAGTTPARAGAPRESCAPRPEPDDPRQREVLALLQKGPRHTDELCRETSRSASEIGRVLFALAVEGHVREVGPGLWGPA